MFIGRKEELSLLNSALAENSSAILVYGKRRIGKTTLIKQALLSQKKTVVYYECIKGAVKENVDAFVQVLRDCQILKFSTNFESFQDVFSYLNTLPQSFVIVIDEYPYLKSMASAEAVDSAFQSIIDNRLSNINLILSGSQIGIMKEMLEEGNALYGRFHCVICLKELSYLLSAAFYSEKSAYEKIAFHSVFGGSPFILKQLRAGESLKQNIIRTILNESSPVYLYAAHLLLSDFSNSMNAERIFSALGNGKKRYSELENILNANKTGNLAKQLKSLTAMEIISKQAPINKLNDTKKSSYEINDNLMRFFFTYVYKSQSALQMLGAEQFYEQYIEPTLTNYISRRFEEICRDYFSTQAKAGRLPGVRNIGSYYYDDPETKTNGEFDVALDYGTHYALYEAKYYSNPMTLDEIHREAGQIQKVTEIRVTQIGFIAANGFAQHEDGYHYLTAEDLYAIG